MSETMMVSQFLLGLKDDIRQVVEMNLPNTVSQATSLAVIQEQLADRPKHYQKKFAPTTKADNKSTYPSSELWKARQLMEYRRLHNLCFKCGEIYTPTHTCALPGGDYQYDGNYYSRWWGVFV
jgi:hypothetical protein